MISGDNLFRKLIFVGEMRQSDSNRRSQLDKQQSFVDYEDQIEERPAITNFKLIFLMFATYGLIVLIY